MPAAWLEEWFESKGDWFDLVARCYSGICRKGLHTPQFLSYFENELDQENSGVDNAIDGISIAVQNCCCLLGDDRKKSLNAISHCLKGVVLQHSSSSIDRGCLLCWMVIAGIDKAFSDLDVVIDMIEIGPLNNLKKDEVGVYYKAEDSVIKGLLSAYGIKQSPEGRFSERLQIFDLVEKVDSFPLPTIKRLSSNLVNFKKASVIFDAQESCLRIGIAACTCSPLFKKEGQDWIKYKLNKGGALSFQYSQAYEERYDELVGRSLQKAIDSDCEIVVFPELVVSPGYIERIQSQLRSISDTRELQLVVAGSGWEPSEDGCFGKNVCHVLDKEGRVQARTTKKIPYIGDAGEKQIIESLDPKAHETCFLDLYGFGRLMTVVCKDLESDKLYTSRLATDFEPDLVCVPAASGSVEGAFRKTMVFLAERAHAICCVANLCSMVGQYASKDLISCISAPSIKEKELQHSRFPTHLFKDFYRENDVKAAACKNDEGSCLFIADIVYGIDSKEEILPSIEVKANCLQKS